MLLSARSIDTPLELLGLHSFHILVMYCINIILYLVFHATLLCLDIVYVYIHSLCVATLRTEKEASKY